MKGKISDRQSSLKSSIGKGKKGSKNSPTEEYLHLMAIADLSALLYPGGILNSLCFYCNNFNIYYYTVNKLHIACPLTTFNENEAFEAAGLKSSYFIPKQEEIFQEEVLKKDRKTREKSPDSASSKSSSQKGKKGGGEKRVQSSVGKNLQEVSTRKGFQSN